MGHPSQRKTLFGHEVAVSRLSSRQSGYISNSPCHTQHAFNATGIELFHLPYVAGSVLSRSRRLL
jgi:hypothetical protein